MCLGIPAQVVALVTTSVDLAEVEIGGTRRQVNVGMLCDGEAVVPGDWVVVHLGFALSKIGSEEAGAVLRSMDSAATEAEWLAVHDPRSAQEQR